MIRRSFRIGLTLGLLGGLAYALTKMLGPRPAAVADRLPAPPVAPPPPPTPAARPAPAPAPDRATEPKPTHHTAPAVPAPATKVPAKKAAAKKAPAAAAWVTPNGDVCPTSHPVKAKLSSKIFHLPGMLNYGRTNPDRCYRDANSAEGDGLRAAKR